ncbi:MAG: hypothetical protein KA978_05595, partial [Deltaproteobacteria bacterium]|nr:hypothetical protein [Deltaproteobacteria bacterium]
MGCERDPGRADVPSPLDASWDRVDASAKDTASDLVGATVDATVADLPSTDMGHPLPDGALVDVRLGDLSPFVADCSVP